MCVLRLGMGLSPFLLRVLIAKQARCLWPVVFCDYRIVLNTQEVKRKQTNTCRLTATTHLSPV